MPSRKKGRAGLFGLALMGALLLCTSSAFAAGPPKVEWFPIQAETQVFSIHPTSAWVKPNGALTTVKFQYRVSGSGGEWLNTPVVSYSGEEKQKVDIRIYGLLPHTKYDIRLTATNEYGTNSQGGEATPFTTRSWGVQAGGTLPASVGSGTYGTGSFNWQFGLQKVSWSCSERVQGQLGNATASSDHYTLYFEGCKMAYNEKVACTLETFHINLGGNLEAQGENKTFYLNFPVGCQSPFGSSAGFTIQEPFKALVPVGEESFAAEQPMTMSSSLSFGGNYGTISISGDKWILTGSNIGKKFGTL